MTLLPVEMLQRHTAILGSTGSGKTSVAKCGIVEPVLRAKGRVLVIDPTGAWWGLRLGADGKRAGFQVYIFGGDHGDYPLAAKNAEVLAEAFGTSSDSAVFDTSLMTVNERCSFFTAFASALMRKNRGPVNVVIDEAHLFMPQAGASVGGQVPAMLHAGNNLVSLGRSKGLRITMITQRPAKLHKDSLTQAQSMIAMRVLSPQDRKAIAEWIAEQADTEKGKEIVASLSALKAGEAWVWAPLQSHLKRTQFPLPTTFDSSKDPDERSGTGPVLAPINMDALKGRLATVEAEAKANDPKELKAEVARLRHELAQAHAATAPVTDSAELNKARIAGKIEGYSEGVVAATNEIRRKIENMGQQLLASVFVDDATLAAHRARLEARQERPLLPATVSRLAPAAKVLPNTSSEAGNSAARKMLAVLDTSPPVRRSWVQVATLAGLRARGGHFNAGKKYLTDNGLVREDSGLVQIANPSADAAAFEHDPKAVVDMWAANLSGAAPKILLHLFANGPQSRDDIAHALGMQPRGGHWNAAWKELRDNDIVTITGSLVRLTEIFGGNG